MRKHANRIPPALKHGIYSGLGLLPTESRAKFRKFRKRRFAELALTGALENDIGEEIIRLEWRRNNLFTYDLAERARYQYNMIYAPLSFSAEHLRAVLADEPKPRSRSPEELAARLSSMISKPTFTSAVTLALPRMERRVDEFRFSTP